MRCVGGEREDAWVRVDVGHCAVGDEVVFEHKVGALLCCGDVLVVGEVFKVVVVQSILVVRRLET